MNNSEERTTKTRAVSNIIAALLLIAVVVASGVLLYVYSLGITGRLGTGGGQQTKEELVLEAYRWSAGTTTISGALRNVGQTAIDVGRTDAFLNGTKITAGLGGSCISILDPTQSCGFQLTVPTGPWVPGAEYRFKLVTPSGGVFSYNLIDGGSG